jgi:phage-related minor tail protein
MDANRKEIISAKAKVSLIYQNIGFEKELSKLRIDGLSFDKYGIEILTVEVNRRKEIASIESKRLEDLSKINLSSAQKGEIEATASANIASANQKAKNDVALIVAQREKELKVIGQQIEFQRQMESFDSNREALDQNHFYMRDKDYQMAVLELETNKKVAELQQQIITAKQNLGEGATYEAEKSRITGLIDAELTLSMIRKKGLDEQERQRTTFTEGWNDAYRKFIVMSEDAGRLGSEMFGSFVGNMNSAIDEFVRTGQLGFADFARNVIQSIIAMILKFQALQIVLGTMRAMGFNPFPAMGGGVNLGSPVTGSFGGGVSVPMAANGGDINGPTIVGERGPELFIPSRQGTVIPNNRLSSMMGQGQTVNYNAPYIANLSAIDTQSATQFLAQHKHTIWAVNQSASRSIPTSR